MTADIVRYLTHPQVQIGAEWTISISRPNVEASLLSLRCVFGKPHLGRKNLRGRDCRPNH
ncbi:hypothetical protein QWJ07_20555 [Frankia sp. RB7]|nr:hypothetical protein [Frankia sp. RB7]